MKTIEIKPVENGYIVSVSTSIPASFGGNASFLNIKDHVFTDHKVMIDFISEITTGSQPEEKK